MPGTGDPIQRMLRQRAAELQELDAPSSAASGGTTRRGFLGRAAAVGAGVLLAGPASALAASRRERRAQARQQARAGARVVVIGAGLAGITCAYRLNQRGIKAQVYEARDGRLGGRCWTVRGFEHGQVAEHGGEFIDTRHVHILRIVAELGLDLEDRLKAERQHPNLERPLWLNGKLQDRAAISAGFDAMFAKLKKDYRRVGDYHYNVASDAAREFDQMTVVDWLTANVDDPLLRELIDIGQSGFFGYGFCSADPADGLMWWSTQPAHGVDAATFRAMSQTQLRQHLRNFHAGWHDPILRIVDAAENIVVTDTSTLRPCQRGRASGRF